MATFGIAMVRDEADILASTLEHMAGQVDGLIIADNGSVDGSRDIIDRYADVVVDDTDLGYYQSAKMTRLAIMAAGHGARWVVPFDADEWWYSPHGRIADVLEHAGDIATAPASVYDHVATGEDSSDPDPIARIQWRRRAANPLVKVACRPCLPAVIEQGNHGVRYPTGAVEDLLVVRHFPYRSTEQFVRKVRNGSQAYAATDLPSDQGAHWRQYGAILDAQGPEAVADIFRTWFWEGSPQQNSDLILDPCPA